MSGLASGADSVQVRVYPDSYGLDEWTEEFVLQRPDGSQQRIELDVRAPYLEYAVDTPARAFSRVVQSRSFSVTFDDMRFAVYDQYLENSLSELGLVKTASGWLAGNLAPADSTTHSVSPLGTPQPRANLRHILRRTRPLQLRKLLQQQQPNEIPIDSTVQVYVSQQCDRFTDEKDRFDCTYTTTQQFWENRGVQLSRSQAQLLGALNTDAKQKNFLALLRKRNAAVADAMQSMINLNSINLDMAGNMTASLAKDNAALNFLNQNTELVEGAFDALMSEARTKSDDLRNATGNLLTLLNQTELLSENERHISMTMLLALQEANAAFQASLDYTTERATMLTASAESISELANQLLTRKQDTLSHVRVSADAEADLVHAGLRPLVYARAVPGAVLTRLEDRFPRLHTSLIWWLDGPLSATPSLRRAVWEFYCDIQHFALTPRTAYTFYGVHTWFGPGNNCTQSTCLCHSRLRVQALANASLYPASDETRLLAGSLDLHGLSDDSVQELLDPDSQRYTSITDTLLLGHRAFVGAIQTLCALNTWENTPLRVVQDATVLATVEPPLYNASVAPANRTLPQYCSVNPGSIDSLHADRGGPTLVWLLFTGLVEALRAQTPRRAELFERLRGAPPLPVTIETSQQTFGHANLTDVTQQGARGVPLQVSQSSVTDARQALVTYHVDTIWEAGVSVDTTPVLRLYDQQLHTSVGVRSAGAAQTTLFLDKTPFSADQSLLKPIWNWAGYIKCLYEACPLSVLELDASDPGASDSLPVKSVLGLGNLTYSRYILDVPSVLLNLEPLSSQRADRPVYQLQWIHDRAQRLLNASDGVRRRHPSPSLLELLRDQGDLDYDPRLASSSLSSYLVRVVPGPAHASGVHEDLQCVSVRGALDGPCAILDNYLVRFVHASEHPAGHDAVQFRPKSLDWSYLYTIRLNMTGTDGSGPLRVVQENSARSRAGCTANARVHEPALAPAVLQVTPLKVAPISVLVRCPDAVRRQTLTPQQAYSTLHLELPDCDGLQVQVLAQDSDQSCFTWARGTSRRVQLASVPEQIRGVSRLDRDVLGELLRTVGFEVTLQLQDVTRAIEEIQNVFLTRQETEVNTHLSNLADIEEHMRQRTQDMLDMYNNQTRRSYDAQSAYERLRNLTRALDRMDAQDASVLLLRMQSLITSARSLVAEQQTLLEEFEAAAASFDALTTSGFLNASRLIEAAPLNLTWDNIVLYMRYIQASGCPIDTDPPEPPQYECDSSSVFGWFDCPDGAWTPVKWLLYALPISALPWALLTVIGGTCPCSNRLKSWHGFVLYGGGGRGD